MLHVATGFAHFAIHVAVKKQSRFSLTFFRHSGHSFSAELSSGGRKLKPVCSALPTPSRRQCPCAFFCFFVLLFFRAPAHLVQSLVQSVAQPAVFAAAPLCEVMRSHPEHLSPHGRLARCMRAVARANPVLPLERYRSMNHSTLASAQLIDPLRSLALTVEESAPGEFRWRLLERSLRTQAFESLAVSDISFPAYDTALAAGYGELQRLVGP